MTDPLWSRLLLRALALAERMPWKTWAKNNRERRQARQRRRALRQQRREKRQK